MRLVTQQLKPDCDPIFVEEMRKIYNESIPFVATKPGVVRRAESEQQHWWYKELDHSNRVVTLYRPEDRPWLIAAFSIVTDHGEYCTPFFCTAHQARGSGIGQPIIDHYLSVFEKPYRGEQLQSNGAIAHLNRRNGWQIIGHEDRPGIGMVDLLYHPGRKRTFPDYKGMLDYWDEDDRSIWNRAL